MKTLSENSTKSKAPLAELSSEEQLVSIVKRLGNPVSPILLDSSPHSIHIFSLSHLDGAIGYLLFKNCAVVFGDPMCLSQDIAELTQAFHLHCEKSNWKIVYFLVSDTFAHWAIDHGCRTLIQVGEKLVLDPTRFQKKQKVRWKINQSLHQGVVIKEYKNFDHSLENQMKQTIEAWLKAKQGPQIHLGKIDLFNHFSNKRIFYAVQKNKIVGLLTLSRIDQFEGWVINYFLSFEDPVGTNEHLMGFVFDILADENCHFLCLGAVAGSKLGKIVGLNTISRIVARLIFRISRWLFHLDARHAHLNKYRPHAMPTYVLTRGNLGIHELLSIKKALNVKL